MFEEERVSLMELRGSNVGARQDLQEAIDFAAGSLVRAHIESPNSIHHSGESQRPAPSWIPACDVVKKTAAIGNYELAGKSRFPAFAGMTEKGR